MKASMFPFLIGFFLLSTFGTAQTTIDQSAATAITERPFFIKGYAGHSRIHEFSSTPLFKLGMGAGFGYQALIKEKVKGNTYIGGTFDLMHIGSKRDANNTGPSQNQTLIITNTFASVKLAGLFGYQSDRIAIEFGFGALRHLVLKTTWIEEDSPISTLDKNDYITPNQEGINPFAASFQMNFGYRINKDLKIFLGADAIILDAVNNFFGSFQLIENYNVRIGIQRSFRIVDKKIQF